MDLSELGKGGATAGAGGLAADIAEGSGLDIAANAVGGAVSVARETLAGLGLELPFMLVPDVFGVLPL